MRISASRVDTNIPPSYAERIGQDVLGVRALTLLRMTGGSGKNVAESRYLACVLRCETFFRRTEVGHRMSRCVRARRSEPQPVSIARMKEKPMFVNHSVQPDSRLVPRLRASPAPRIEIAPMTHLADLGRCEVLFIDYDDWVAAYLYDHGVVIDSAARTKAFVEQQARELLTGRSRLYVAYLDGRPAGVLALTEVDEEDAAEVTRLFVRATARRRGVARALLERLIQDARSLGYRTLQIRMLSFMKDARLVYDAAGFKQKQKLDELTMLMERELESHANSRGHSRKATADG
jgi:GNAT superfamily N-acetyltransferase